MWTTPALRSIHRYPATLACCSRRYSARSRGGSLSRRGVGNRRVATEVSVVRCSASRAMKPNAIRIDTTTIPTIVSQLTMTPRTFISSDSRLVSAMGSPQMLVPRSLQVPREEECPHAPDGQKRHEIRPTVVDSGRRDAGQHQPTDVDEVACQRDQGDQRQRLRPARQMTEQEETEWDCELQGEKAERHVEPVRPEPRKVPEGLVRQILGPDDQELHEREVHPRHDEGEEHVSKIP